IPIPYPIYDPPVNNLNPIVNVPINVIGPSKPSDNPDNQPMIGGKTLKEWIKALSDLDPSVRGQAAAALGQLGPQAAPAVPALIADLNDTDAMVRVQVTTALAQIGAEAIPALKQALKSEDKYVRMGACLALGHMGSAAQSAIPALTELLK